VSTAAASVPNIARALLDAPAGAPGSLLAQIQTRLRGALAGSHPSSSAVDRCIAKLASEGEVTDEEARSAFHMILKGGLADDRVAAFLVLLAPERLAAATIAAFADVVHEHATRVDFRPGGPVGDTCGTGGDGRGTFNVSTTIMFILAAGGFPIAKHGNRAFTSKCGSADVLEALGACIDLDAEGVAACLRETNAGFMFAPRFHGSFKNVGIVRKRLADEMPPFIPRKTIFNALGPLSNPASATHRVIGVFDETLTLKFAEVLRRRGVTSALVPHGLPAKAGEKGLDEFSTFGPTVYAELTDGQIVTKTIEPEQAGLPTLKDAGALDGGEKGENARILRRILELRESPERIDFALLNAGAGFYAGRKAESIREGVSLARRVLESGAALRTLDAFCGLSRRLGETRREI
jgi:anthranilate phosphoribosyltransferase